MEILYIYFLTNPRRSSVSLLFHPCRPVFGQPVSHFVVPENRKGYSGGELQPNCRANFFMVSQKLSATTTRFKAGPACNYNHGTKERTYLRRHFLVGENLQYNQVQESTEYRPSKDRNTSQINQSRQGWFFLMLDQPSPFPKCPVHIFLPRKSCWQCGGRGQQGKRCQVPLADSEARAFHIFSKAAASSSHSHVCLEGRYL